MSANGTLQISLFALIVILLAKPVGLWMATVVEGKRTIFHPLFGWIERWVYKVMRVSPDDEQHWTRYAASLLAFSLVSMLATYGMLRLQGMLPLNPQGFGAKQMTPDLAFNTASSFMTNTNWQNYSPEVTISHFSNMVALAIHNWASAAVGLAVAAALIRGFARRNASGIGNFWADVVRVTLYILLPISIIGAIVFVSQGVPQTMDAYVQATTIEGKAQRIAVGPVASQEIIKQLGTNGGGFFNANSAHPFENPTPLSDLFTKLLIFLIPAGLTYTFGRMVGNTKQGWVLLAAMMTLFLAGAFVAVWAENSGNPNFAQLGVQPANMEGKEARFGIVSSALFAAVTTGASNGAVNSMHGSYTPMGALVPLFNMMSGEVIFGGVGAGLYGMLIFAIIAVFIAGLMVGRTPEYLGKKIESFEVKMCMLAVLSTAASILLFTALASTLQLPKEGSAAALNTWPGSAYGSADRIYGPPTGNLNNAGPRGFEEILYAYSSGTGNNGSAMAGLTGNTPFYNVTLGLSMIIGRFMVIIPILAIAGSLARKKFIPITSGTFPTDNTTFAGLLVGVVLLVGALTFIPALALGPIVEHFQMQYLRTQ